MENLKFPIEQFEKPANYTNDVIKNQISEIEAFPNQLKQTF